MTRLEHVDYLVPNETEAELISRLPVHTIDDAARCAERLHATGVGCAVITLGSRGALICGSGGVEHVRAPAVDTVDSTGAGDAFIGSFAVFLAEGFDEREAVLRANLYAALSTTSVGTQKSFLDRASFDAEWTRRGPR